MAKKKRPAWRPVKFDPEKAEVFLELLSKGNYLSTACDISGINERTVYAWIAGTRGKHSQRIQEFVQAIKKTNAQAEDDLLNVVMKAANGYTLKREKTKYEAGEEVEKEVVTETKFDWTAAMTILERKFPDKWGRRPQGSPPEEGTKDEQFDDEFL